MPCRVPKRPCLPSLVYDGDWGLQHASHHLTESQEGQGSQVGKCKHAQHRLTLHGEVVPAMGVYEQGKRTHAHSGLILHVVQEGKEGEQ